MAESLVKTRELPTAFNPVHGHCRPQDCDSEAATAADVARLYASVEAYLEGLSRMTPLTFATVSEAAAVLG